MSYIHVTITNIVYDLQETGALVLEEKHLGFGSWPGFLKALGNISAGIGIDCQFHVQCSASGKHRLVVKGDDTKKPLTRTQAMGVIKHIQGYCNAEKFKYLLKVWRVDKRLFVADSLHQPAG